MEEYINDNSYSITFQSKDMVTKIKMELEKVQDMMRKLESSRIDANVNCFEPFDDIDDIPE